MGADLCSNNLFDFDDFPNDEPKIIKKEDKIIREEIQETIQENISMYSNLDMNETKDKEKNERTKNFYRNYDDINNLKSSIFDNEENEHVKKYEQEINAEEHPYLFSSYYNLNKKDNSKDNSKDNGEYIKNYTFKNSPSGLNNISNISNHNSNKNIDYDKSNEFISNNRSSFKKMEIMRSKKNIGFNEQFISFGNTDNKKNEDIKQQNEVNDYEHNYYSKENDNDMNINNNNEINDIIDNKEKEKEEKEKEQLVINDEIKEKTQNSDEEDSDYQEKINNMNKNRNQSNISDIIQINDEIIESLTIANNLPNNQRNDRTMLNQSKDFGVRYYSNGAIYIGQFKDDKCNGYGKYKQENDDIIVGIFQNNYLHEYGIIERKNTNSIYEGELQNNTFYGIGIELFRDNSKYLGEFYNNKKHGIGTYYWSDESQYQGEWKNGVMDGYGIFKDALERIYEGTWKKGKMDGYGIYKWSDGRKYLGNFREDKREGFGIFFWKNQLKIYAGYWLNGEQNGYGKIYTPIKEKNFFWYKGKQRKFFYDSETMIKEIMKGNDIKIKKKIKCFEMSFDEILSLMMEI